MHSSAPTSRVEDGLVLPDGASVLTRLRLAIRALRVLDKRPDDHVAASLFNASIDGDVFQRLCEELAATDEGRALLAERPSLQGSALKLEALARLPVGTLGHSFAEYFCANGIKPFESPYEVRNDVDYLVKWYRETHDLHHILTGYRTDALGEMELQAFMAGNLGLRTSLVILIFAALLRPHGLPPIWKYLDQLKAAHRRGRASMSVLRLRYEKLWETPVEVLQKQLRLAPLKSAPS